MTLEEKYQKLLTFTKYASKAKEAACYYFELEELIYLSDNAYDILKEIGEES